MPCYSIVKPNQTKAQRKLEIQKATAAIDRMIAAKKVIVKVGPQGAVTFVGIPASVRDGMTDVCVYRGIMAKGSQAAKMQMAKAAQMAGVRVNEEAITQGIHSHDGGATWHPAD
jgi:hypothetical protein